MTERDCLGGAPQPTKQERAKRLAPILVEMVHQHSASQEEIEAQIARELYCSVAVMRSGN